MKKKRILVLSYFTNMPGACQAEWVDDRMKALLAQGYEIVVFSSICTFPHVKEGMRHIRIPSFTPNGFIYEYEELQRRKIPLSNSKAIVYKSYYRICLMLRSVLKRLKLNSGEGRWGWFFTSVLAAMPVMLQNRQFSFIYSTGGPASTHLLGILIRNLFNIRLLVELQDPLSGDGIGRNPVSRKGLQAVERFIISKADKTLYCTRNAMLEARKRYPDYASRIEFVYPGSVFFTFDSEIHSSASKDTPKINITYLGSLYQTRNLDTLMEAMRRLEREGLPVASHFEVNLYGNINADIKARIQSFELDVMRMHGLVSREAANRKAAAADVLLLIQNSDLRSVVTIPFKTYDYLHTRKLILGLIYRNDELNAMLKDHGHLCCEVDDVPGIANALRTISEDISVYTTKICKSRLTPDFAAKHMLNLIENND